MYVVKGQSYAKALSPRIKGTAGNGSAPCAAVPIRRREVISAFTKGHVVRMRQPDTGNLVVACYVDGVVSRWIQRGAAHVLRKFNAIAKDAEIYEKVIQQFCKTIEVLDMANKIVYIITVDEFDEKKWLLNTKSGEQWAVDKTFWNSMSWEEYQRKGPNYGVN